MNPIIKATSLGEWRRAAVALFCALCVFGMAALFFFSGDTVFRIASLLPALIGLLLLYSTFHSLLAAGTPPTVLVLAEEMIRRGKSAKVVIRQAGPVVLHSLRANLVCERHERREGSWVVTFPQQVNFFDSAGRVEVARHDTADFESPLSAPADAEASSESATLIVEWRIEIWGKVDGGADFMRPFPIDVA